MTSAAPDAFRYTKLQSPAPPLSNTAEPVAEGYSESFQKVNTLGPERRDWHAAMVGAQEAFNPHIERVGDQAPEAATPSARLMFHGPAGELLINGSTNWFAVLNVTHPEGGAGTWNVELIGGTVNAASTNAAATPVMNAV
ncbi:MAG: hypothetical protein ACREEC_08585 [Thermoplasmata archaeon]